MLTSDSLSSFRRIMFAITGLTCLVYAALALLQVRPDPFPFWIPGILGIISAALIFALAAAGRKNAKHAFGACVLDCNDFPPNIWDLHGNGHGCPAHGICGDGDACGCSLSVAVYLL